MHTGTIRRKFNMVLYKNIAFLPLHPSEMAVIIVHGCLASFPAQEANTRHLWLSTPVPRLSPTGIGYLSKGQSCPFHLMQPFR